MNNVNNGSSMTGKPSSGQGGNQASGNKQTIDTSVPSGGGESYQGGGDSYSGSDNQVQQGPSAAELEAQRRAAESTNKRRDKDASIAADAANKAKERRENQPQSPKPDSQVTPQSDTAKQQDQSTVRPQVQIGDGTHAAGYIDQGTGEIVTQDLSGRDTYFEAPTTSGAFKPRAVDTTPDAIDMLISGQTPEDIDAMNLKIPLRQTAKVTSDQGNTVETRTTPSQDQYEREPNPADYHYPEVESTPQKPKKDKRRQSQTNMSPGNTGSVMYNEERREKKKETPEERKKRERKFFNKRAYKAAHEDYAREIFPNEVRPAEETGLETEFDPNAEINFLSDTEISRQKNREAAELMQDQFKSGDLPAVSRYLGKNKEEKFEDKTEHQLNQIQHLYGCNRWAAKVLVLLRLGIGIDSNKHVFNESHLEYEIPDSAIQKACNEIFRSQVLNGHPLGMIDSPPMILNGTRCFPIGVIPRYLAQELTSKGGVLEDVTPIELINRAGKSWANYTLPHIMANLKGDDISQRWALENMVRALCNIDGISAKKYHVADEIPRSIAEIREQNRRMAKADPDNAAVWEDQNKNLKEAEVRFMKTRGRKPVKDENGNIVGYEKRSLGYSILNGIASTMRFMGVMGNIPILVSAPIEKAWGNVQTWALDGMFFEWYDNAAPYKPTEKMKLLMDSEEACESVNAVSALYHAGGMDAIKVFSARGYEFTKEGVMKFISEANGSDRKTTKAMAWVQRLTDIVMPADYFMKKGTSRRFFNNLMIAQYAEKQAGRQALTAAEIEEALSFGENIPKVMSQLMGTNAGREALITCKNLTLDRINPWSAMVMNFLRSHGVTDALATGSLDTYITYGMNFLQLIAPLSNTFSYLAVAGINKHSLKKNGENSDLVNYQMGGQSLIDSKAFGEGLKKNLIYDTMKFGSTALIAIIAYGIIEMFGGLDDPPEELKYNYDEYLIAGKAVHQTWWMPDLTSFGWPLAIAMHVRNNHPDDPDRVLGVLYDGIADMIGGASVVDAVKFIRDYAQNIAEITNMYTNPDYTKPDDFDSMAARMFFTQLGSTFVGKMTPSFLKWYRDSMIVGPEAPDRDPFHIYDRSKERIHKEDGEHLSQDDRYNRVYAGEEDSFMRRMAIQNGPILGVLFNIFRNGYLIDDGTSEKTGYLFTEMPAARDSDPTRTFFLETTRFDENLAPHDSPEAYQAYCDAHAARLIEYINSLEFSSPAEAVANNFMIEPAARINAANYCYDMINKINLRYVEECEQGMYPDFQSSFAASTKRSSDCKFYYDMLDNWFKNDDIPWRDDGYERLLTNTQQVYYWKDSGKPATALDAFFNPAVETRYIPFGDHQTSFLPYTVRDDRDTVRNGEQISGSYIEELNDPTMLRNIGPANISGNKPTAGFMNFTIPYGVNKGQNLGQTVFGGATVSPNIPSSGLRGVRSVTDKLPDELVKSTIESSAERLGIDLDDLNAREDAIKNGNTSKGNGSGNKNYGSGSRNYSTYKKYYGGGGGSSYNPKIYSNAKSVSNDRAASMYTKQPYGPTISYLRPNFSTKGSREAYKRSDM